MSSILIYCSSTIGRNIAFPKYAQPEGLDVLLPFEIIVDSGSEGAGAHAVNHADRGQVRKACVIQIFIQFCYGFIHRLAQKIDLRAYGEGFAIFNLPFPVFCICLAV